MTNTNVETTGKKTPIASTQSTSDAVGIGLAQYGLVGAFASVGSNTQTSDQASGTGEFRDIVFVTGSTAMIPVTVTMSLNGYGVIDSDIGSQPAAGPPTAQIQIQLTSSLVNATTFSVLGSTTYLYTDQNAVGAEVTGYPKSSGSFTFAASVPNNSYVYFAGMIEVTTSGNDGGSATGDYQNTAVFNINSTDSTATFTGQYNTNYATLTDTASAPEPGSLALLLLPVGAATVIGAARRRKSI